MSKSKIFGSALWVVLTLGSAACEDDDGEGGSGGEADSGREDSGGGSDDAGGDGSDAGTDAGGGGDGGGGSDDGGTSGDCPDIEDRDEVLVSGEIDEDTTWTCDKLYILTDKVYITSDATLTIEAGTEVQGDNGGALVSTVDGRLVTEGTKDAPVVFTSSNVPGNRAAGDWAGVVLLGKAPINVPGGSNGIEGIDPSENRGEYGGSDEGHDCGHIKYTRIEFAGELIAIGNELNSLTLGGCGTGTTVEYVQTHWGLDDGVEVFGGSPKLHHLLMSRVEDDSLDWDFGFDGQVQFVAIVQHPANSDKGFEADNSESTPDATPRSQPTIYNVTMVGGAQSGWHARRGTWGTVSNAIITGFDIAAVNVDGKPSADGARMSSPKLLVQNSIFFDNGADGDTHFPSGMSDDMNDDNFDEDAFFREADLENKFDEDPELPDPTSLTAPKLVPPASSPAASGGATPPSGFDTSATYIGAFKPGGDDWTAGWTAYPED